MFKKMGRLTTAHPWLIFLAWICLGIGLSLAAPPWDSKVQDDDIRFLPGRCPSVRGYLLLQKAFPQEIFASRAILAIERQNGSLADADYALVDRLVAELNQLRADQPELQIGSVHSYRDGLLGNRLTSSDKQCTLIQVALGTPFLAVQTRATVDRIEQQLRAIVNAAGPQAPTMLVTGPAGLGRDLVEASAKSLEGTTLATVGLVVVVLLLVYRAPLLALVPIATIAVSVWVSIRLLALMTLLPGVHLVNISKIFAIVILYGAGTDYCLFLISRYREELGRTWKRRSAIRRSVRAVGGALAASAGTVICGLGLMGFAEFAKVRCAGPAIAVGLAVGLAASLTLTPALLTVLGRAVFWPRAIPTPKRTAFEERGWREETPATFWERISRGVVARPILIWCSALLVLTPLVILGARVAPNYRSTGELPSRCQSNRGVAVIQRHFTAGEIGPMTVLLASRRDWSSPEGRRVISHLSRGFGELANVAEVRSLTQPLGSPLPVVSVGATPTGLLTGMLKSVRKGIDGALAQAREASRSFYIATVDDEQGREFVTRLDIVFHSDPFERGSIDTADTIQTWLKDQIPRTAKAYGTVRSEVYGVTVNSVDLATVTEADRRRVNWLVLTGITLILIVLVRKIWLAGYLLLTVLFSYYATLGATVLVSAWVSGRPLDQVEWRVPFFLFTILVAVGEDYNILLITRVLQEKRRYGAIEGTRRALAKTGGTITSCGLIMAGTFATLMLAGLGTLVQIGFALAFGVLLDTFIVRPFLVPAFVLMVWRHEQPQLRKIVRLYEEPKRLAG